MEDFFEQLTAVNTQQRLSWFRYLNQTARPGGIVFVGDSITQEFLVHEMLREHSAVSSMHNRGIGGDTTSGLLKRMEDSIYHLQPAKVFLLIGINDLADSHARPEAVASRIQEIAALTLQHCPKAELYLESVYPINESNASKIDRPTIGEKSNKRIDQINDILKTFDGGRLHYLNLNSSLKDNDGNLKLEYTREGLHLTPLGYSAVVQELSQYL